MNKNALTLAALMLAAAPLQTFADAGIAEAASESLGFYPSSAFVYANGTCVECRTSRQAAWYFQKEQFAAPRAEDLPPLVWLGSSKVIDGIRLASDGKAIETGDKSRMGFAVVPKLSTNLSYYNEDSAAFFSKRPLRLRGEVETDKSGRRTFVARTIWPADFTVKPSQVQSLTQGETLQSLVKAEQGGAKSSYATRVLWQRTPVQDWSGKTIVGLMLNGAQGDDDEAHGGHFGVVTGNYTDGSMHHWLVNNFYGINSISEKGILAGVTPMDKYLMDLNNGQSFYRPSYMLVAVLKSDRVARAYQSEMNGVFERFYKHDFEYDHAKANCSGITSDGFRKLGWNIPAQGNPDQIKAIPAYAYVSATEGSLKAGRKIYDYLTEEATRLYPAAAFDAMGNDLLALAKGEARRTLTDFEKQLGSDVEALVFVRIPQVPSSRAYGLAPVASFSEYLNQAPKDRGQWKIVPTEPRPFPDALREHQPAAADAALVPLPVALAALALFLLLATVMYGVTRWRRRRTTPDEAKSAAPVRQHAEIES